MNKNRKKNRETESTAEAKLKGFLDMIAPSVIQFYTDHYICGNTYRSVWALREYPTATDEQAILRHLGEKDGVTLRIYTRQVTPAEEKKIISNAANKNRMKQGNTENLQETVTAASNLQDVTTIISTMHRNREPLLHTAVFLELSAPDMEKLKLLQTEVLTELIRSKLNVDKLLLRQKQGFLCVHPAGRNVFREQFERALPASSVANLFPFNYSGKTDKNGFYIGRDKFGSNVIVDFNQRADDKTNANILILGNSGQGKSYLLKLILTILRQSGMKVICLDPEHEYIDLTNNLGGCFPLAIMKYRKVQNLLRCMSSLIRINTMALLICSTKEITGYTNDIKSDINRKNFGFVFSSENAVLKDLNIQNIMVYKARNLLTDGKSYEPIYKTQVTTYIQRVMRLATGDFKQENIVEFFSSKPTSQRSRWMEKKDYINAIIGNGDDIRYSIDETAGYCTLDIAFNGNVKNLEIEINRVNSEDRTF